MSDNTVKMPLDELVTRLDRILDRMCGAGIAFDAITKLRDDLIPKPLTAERKLELIAERVEMLRTIGLMKFENDIRDILEGRYVG